MVRVIALVGWVAAALLVSGARAQDLYEATPGPYPVQKQDLDWRDEARQRDVPVRLYVPQTRSGAGPYSRDVCVPGKDGKPGEPVPPGPFAVIVFSHGMGASRQTYGYICEHLASHGYLVVAPTHIGSDTSAIREELAQHRRDGARGKRDLPLVVENTADPENLKNRPLDVAFVLDRIGKDKELCKLADLSRVGVAGHSFGAHTAMEVAGMTVELPARPRASFRDARVKAAVAMSPQGAGAMGVVRESWKGVAVPVLFLTGTKDYGQGERAADWRREAFDAIKGVDEYLLVLKDATHFTFAQGPGMGLRAEHAREAAMIKAATTAFFDAYVKGDARAKAWLAAFAGARHEDCTAEFHPAK